MSDVYRRIERAGGGAQDMPRVARVRYPARLTQLRDVQNFTYAAIMRLKESLRDLDGKLKVTTSDALAIAEIVNSFGQAVDRCALLSGQIGGKPKDMRRARSVIGSRDNGNPEPLTPQPVVLPAAEPKNITAA